MKRNLSAALKAEPGKRIAIRAYSGAAVNLGFGEEVIELSSLQIAPAVPVLMEHSRELRVGVADSFDNDGRELVIYGRSFDTESGAEFRELAEEGFPWQSSVGTSFAACTRVPEGEEVEVNGRTFAGPITVLREGVLREVSVVSVGADADTSARAFAAEFTEMNANDPKGDTVAEQEAPVGATVGELRAAFPGESEFVLDQIEKGSTVEGAKAEFAGILVTRLAASEARNAELSASLVAVESKLAVSGVTAVSFSAPSDSTPAVAPVFLTEAEELEHEWKTGSEAHRAEFMGDFKLFSAYRIAEAKGLVRVRTR